MIELIRKLPNAIMKRWWRWTVPMRLRSLDVTLGVGVTFHGMPIVSTSKSARISIGDRVVLTSSSAFTALGVSTPCVLRTMRSNATIHICEDTGISGSVICAAQSIYIGKNCLFGAGVMVVDNDFHPILPEGRRYSRDHSDIACAPVVIEDNVFIGARSIVLKGVRIGKDSVIGAGSVVVSDIPSGVVAAGNPARPIRSVLHGL